MLLGVRKIHSPTKKQVLGPCCVSTQEAHMIWVQADDKKKKWESVKEAFPLSLLPGRE